MQGKKILFGRVAVVIENILKMIFFQIREKAGKFVVGQDLERTLKVREIEI